jgi:2-polyprenyl-3-methyl-5-hydroxy-6-metoxy-1,4-benzoquinol methylase
MKRTIEKLTRQRKERQDEFSINLDKIKKRTEEFSPSENISRLQHLSSHLKEVIEAGQKVRALKKIPSLESFQNQVFTIFSELQDILGKNLNDIKELFIFLANLIESCIALIDAKDKEWDALGSNHVGMIFKSMEWRVDKLASSYEDVNLLMKKFIHLKEKLDELLSALEEKSLPSKTLVSEILQPLEDWRYAGFENRYRGSEEEVKKQQSQFLLFFKQAEKVLDLGCGRGEFLELLQENGIDAEGIDVNEQMVEICRDKGLNCRKGDILETLTKCQDNSLGGIFSSQVIEHLPASYLKTMIELAYFKLAPGSHLVLETLNPTSVFALVQTYFLDLTHNKPIHPQTLKFFMETSGFEDVEIHYSALPNEERLQTLPGADETASILNRNIDNLNKLLYAATNYAAVGIKK